MKWQSRFIHCVYVFTVFSALFACTVSYMYAKKAEAALNVRDDLATAYHGLVTVERTQRAFIITGNVEYVDDYHQALDQLRKTRKSIAERSTDGLFNNQDFSLFDYYLDQRLLQIRDVMSAAVSGNSEHMKAMIDQNEDRDLNITIFKLAQNMVSVEQSRLSKYQSRQLSQLAILSFLIVLIGATGIISLMARPIRYSV